mgnify:CR=1 FL=1
MPASLYGILSTMNILDNIVEWNRERGILDIPFDHLKETSFIIEELLESTGQFDSQSAREKAEQIASSIVKNGQAEEEKLIDAWADIIVFATGAMAKLGYNPNEVMQEVCKEINSRTGKMVDGKFIKDKDIEPYVADFSNCKL